MRPLQLRLKGFIGVRLGLGLEEVAVDLSDLSGLVALVGGNGKGKTTLLDNLHPFRVMPYALRSSDGWNPGAFSYYDHVQGQGEKELVFEHGGGRYRSLVVIDADRRKQEAYLFRDEGGAWVPFNEATKAGKTGEYDAAIEQLVASPSLFFNAVFRSQGARPLSECKRSEIMGVVAELLNVDHVLEQGKKALKAAGILQKTLDADNVRLSALLAEVAQTAEVKQRLDVLRGLLQEKTARLTTLREELTAAGEHLAALRARETRAAEDRQRLEALRQQLAATAAEIVTIREAIAAAERNREERLGAVQSRFGRGLTDLDRQEAAAVALLRGSEAADADARTTLGAKREKVQKILAHTAEIRAKVGEEETKRADLDREKARLMTLEAEYGVTKEDERKFIAARAALATAKATLAAEVTDREKRLAAAKQEHAAAEREAARLNDFACAGKEPKYAGCIAIKSAVEAQEKLPDLWCDVAFWQDPKPAEVAAGAEVERLAADMDALAGAPAAADAAADAYNAQRGTISAIETELAELARWTRLVPELDHAEATLVEVGAATANADTALAAARSRHDATMQDLAARRVDLRTETGNEQEAVSIEIAAQLDDLQDRLTAARLKAAEVDLQAEALAATLGEDLAAEIHAAEGSVQDLETAAKTAEAERAELIGEQGAALGRASDLLKKGEAAAALKGRVRRLESEVAGVSLLAKACSNDGIVALEVDDAGPSISAIANDLLRDYDGGRYSVRLETQREKQKGGMAEDFDVTVFDATTGTQASLFRKSGGQVVYVDDAIVRAFRLYMTQRAAAPFEAIFSDERDGALSPDRRSEFFELKRRAMEVGGYRAEFFVSHTREIQEAADAAIIVGDVPEDLLAALSGPVVRVGARAAA
jgi:exonuclease SbcC